MREREIALTREVLDSTGAELQQIKSERADGKREALTALEQEARRRRRKAQRAARRKGRS